MTKTSVLFIGIKNIPEQKNGEMFRIQDVEYNENGYCIIYNNMLSFHDYDVVFINYPGHAQYPSEPTGFLNYIHGKGVAVVFLGPHPYPEFSYYYPWRTKEKFIKILISEGYYIKPNTKHWSKIIFNYKFKWHCLLDPGIDIVTDEFIRKASVFEDIGSTKSDKCVSAIIHLGKGKLILLPLPEDMSTQLIREILDGIKNNYFEIEEKENKPVWMERYNLDIEIRLQSEIDNIVNKINYYKSIREMLLNGCGIELSHTVYKVFKDIGFDAKYKEYEGIHDIEIMYNNFFAVIEVSGTKYANNDNIRELFDHHSRMKKPNIKGIFVVNHFKEKDPIERGKPYTDEALNLAKDKEFCLLTTVDLLQMYNEFLKKNITTEQIADKLRITKGLMIYKM